VNRDAIVLPQECTDSGVSFSTIQVQNLSIGFSRRKPILHGLECSIARGRILAVVGPNGSGKTTLFRTITGELAPLGGGIWCVPELGAGAKLSVLELGARRKARIITRVLQNEYPAWPVSVRDYIRAGAFAEEGWLGGRAGANQERLAEVMRFVDVEDLAERPVTQLSGGEFKRVVIARALLQDPDFFLLDEPTASLDINHQIEILEILQSLACSGKGIALSVHDLNHAALIADEVLLVGKGRVLGYGTPADILNAGLIQEAFGVRVDVQFDLKSGRPIIMQVPIRRR